MQHYAKVYDDWHNFFGSLKAVPNGACFKRQEKQLIKHKDYYENSTCK